MDDVWSFGVKNKMSRRSSQISLSCMRPRLARWRIQGHVTEVTSDLLEARHEHLQDGDRVPGVLDPGAEEGKTTRQVCIT